MLFLAYKNSVARPALFQAAAHALHLHVESASAQSLLEFSILTRRPNRQHAIHLERRAGRGDSVLVIEPVVARVGKCARAVVHVEQYGVELPRTRTKRDADVRNL